MNLDKRVEMLERHDVTEQAVSRRARRRQLLELLAGHRCELSGEAVNVRRESDDDLARRIGAADAHDFTRAVIEMCDDPTYLARLRGALKS